METRKDLYPFTMKRISEKFRRKVKYLRVSYQQASGRDRFNMALFAVLLVAYAWWVSIVF
jgi:hypothetical protein